MKKLMIAAAIVCVATFAQAAGFDWNFATYIEDANGYGVNGSILLSNDSGWSTTIAIVEGTAADTLTGLDYGTYNATVQIDNFLVEGPKQESGTLAGWSYDINSLPLPGYADAEGSLMAVSDDLTAFANLNYGLDLTQNAAGNGYTPAPVPEPTSGLLLLLGIAGMALRRRRA